MTRSEMVANEKVKLAVKGCNALAASCVTVGVFTPLATLLIYLDNGLIEDRLFPALLIMVVSIVLGAYLHSAGRRLLEGLQL